MAFPIDESINPISKGTPIISATDIALVESYDTDLLDTNYRELSATRTLTLYSINILGNINDKIDIYSLTNYTAYNLDFDAPTNVIGASEDAYSILTAVNDAVDSGLAELPLFSNKNEFFKNQHSGSIHMRCLLAVDYSEHQRSGTAVVLTQDEITSITNEQALLTTPNIISPYVIDKVMREATINNSTRKKAIMEQAVTFYDSFPPFSEGVEQALEAVCDLSNEIAGDNYMKSATKIDKISKDLVNYPMNLSTSKLEIGFSQINGKNEAFVDNIQFYGIDVANTAQNTVTKDVVDNIVLKNMLLNRVFGWNNDQNSLLSINSLKQGKFTTLYEGTAIYFANQKFNSRSKSTSCNPANIDDSCIYPENYGEYGLLISYLLSGNDTAERNAKTAQFTGFLISLEQYNTQGCDVQWRDVSFDKVKMSDVCIEKAFNNAKFTKRDGSELAWSDLKTNWDAIKADYITDVGYTSNKSANEVIQ